MQEQNTGVQAFRRGLYNFFPKRADAIMNLLDALTRLSSFLTYAALKDILLLKIRANKK